MSIAMSTRPGDAAAVAREGPRTMRISHNLRAALEYDEQTRATTERSSSPGPSPHSSTTKITDDSLLTPNMGGLPPPPRPKSRASSIMSKKKTPPTSPTSPKMPTPPQVSNTHSPNTNPHVGSIPSTPNPYVNPPPRIPRLMDDATGGSWAHMRRPSLPETSPRGFASDSPRSEKGSPVSGSESRAGFQRHLRYLSGLPGVLRRQTLAVGRSNDEGESRPSTPSPGREQQHWQGHGTDGEQSGSVRSGGARPAQDTDPAGLTRLPGRSLISHARRGSAASTTASSESSHDPATPTDPRISVSSTAYNDSLLSFRDDHRPDAPLTPLSMSDSDHESFIDLVSPTFSPRLHDFTSNAAYGSAAGQQSSHASSSRSHHHHHHHKPKLPHISTKPPVPTSPKPDFRRSRSAQRHAPRDSSVSPVQEVTVSRTLPPTTNLLNPHERAERVRKTRKLAQVFGQTPAAVEAMAFSQLSFEANVPTGLLCAPGNLAGKRKHQRGAVSMSVAPASPEPQSRWNPPDTEASRYAALSARRHSTPLTPDSYSFMDETSPVDLRSTESANSRHSSVVIEISSQQGAPYSDWSSHADHAGPTSPTSFIDLSEEEVLADGVSSIISLETPKGDRRPGLPHSASSIYSFTSDELAEEERRRKREKLAKLHRFLGSRVPVDLVLNQLSVDGSLDLPPVAPSSAVERSVDAEQMDADARKVWLRRRRSSSAAELSSKWSDDIDRLKEELNDKEKAQNVKRALKMEKMFGVAPPQTLYHTRSAAPPVGSAASSTAQQIHPIPQSPGSPGTRNINQGAYHRKSKTKSYRPGTADSTEPLMGSGSRLGAQTGFSEVYEHYRHSLNSLNDIIDRDDRESLHHLHSLIHGDPEPSLQPFARQEDSPPSSPPTPKAERRRSLPVRASMTSLFSEYSISTITSPSVEETSFQARRRRAAKLTQFFGVDYRDLVNEVFDSLEKGLEEEGGRGTLKPDEVQELLNKLRKLKTKRNSLFD